MSGTTAYAQDAGGNLKSRVNSGSTGTNIMAVAYNHLNLPNTITATAGNTVYTYDAGGRKLRSVFGGTATDYIDGVEWEGGTLNLIHMEEGRIVKSGATYSYEYLLRDHLRNTRSGFRGTAPHGCQRVQRLLPFRAPVPAEPCCGDAKK